MSHRLNDETLPRETDPLLDRTQSNESHTSDKSTNDKHDTTSPPGGCLAWLRLPTFTTINPRYRYLPLVGCLIILFNEAEFFFKQAATMRAVESLFCIEYWNDHDPPLPARLGKKIPERLCKADVIEKQVAQAWAWVMLARMICAIIGAIPLGRLADTKGRWPVLVMHKVSVVVTALWQLVVYLAYPKLPIWSIYFGGLAALFGGNFDLSLAFILTSYTDVMPDATQRTSLFFLTTAMQYIAQAICPPIGGLLMNLDGNGTTPLVPIALGIAMGVVAVLLNVFFFPETKDAQKRLRLEVGESLPEDDETSPNPKKVSGKTGANPFKVIMRKTHDIAEKMKSGLEGIGVLNCMALTLSIFLVSVALKAIDWFGMVQYPVIRLGWSYSRAAGVPSVQAVVTMTVFFIILPTSTSLLTKRYKLSAKAGALTIMSASLTLLFIGSTLMGFSSTAPLFFVAMVIYTLGSGFGTTAQSYIANCVKEDKLASVLAILSVAATGGKVGASALWPQLLGVGLNWGTNVGKGLPLLAAAAGFVLAAAGVAFVASAGTKKTAVDETGLSGD